MPSKALKFCRHPGCDELVTGGYCEAHQAEAQAEYMAYRGTAAQQGYDKRWQKVRLSYLGRHPVCERCEANGLTTVASMVHHKIPIKQGGAKYDHSNLMALCNDCHEAIHKPDRWKRRQ